MDSFITSAGSGPVTVVSRSTDNLDIVIAGLDGRVYTAAWQPGNKQWQGWWPVGNIRAPPDALVSAVSRSAYKLGTFAAGRDARVYTAAWQPEDSGRCQASGTTSWHDSWVRLYDPRQACKLN